MSYLNPTCVEIAVKVVKSDPHKEGLLTINPGIGQEVCVPSLSPNFPLDAIPPKHRLEDNMRGTRLSARKLIRLHLKFRGKCEVISTCAG